MFTFYDWKIALYKVWQFFSPFWAKLLNSCPALCGESLIQIDRCLWVTMPSNKVHFRYLCMYAWNRNYFTLIKRMTGSYTMWTTIFFFFLFLSASSTLPEPQRCADISDFHLQQRGNSVVSLISATIWLERGDDFCLWNAALKLCSRPCFKFTCERVMAHSSLPAEAHWPHWPHSSLLIHGLHISPSWNILVESSKEDSQAHLWLRAFFLCKLFFFSQKTLPCTRMATRRYCRTKPKYVQACWQMSLEPLVCWGKKNPNQMKMLFLSENCSNHWRLLCCTKIQE